MQYFSLKTILFYRTKGMCTCNAFVDNILRCQTINYIKIIVCVIHVVHVNRDVYSDVSVQCFFFVEESSNVPVLFLKT